LCGVEADPQACETYAANFPDVALFKGDIARFLLDEQLDVPTLDALLKAGVDVVYGGPPCQGFSQIGPRKSDDPRNLLYKEFVRVIQALQPRALVMENVPNMIAMENGRFKDEMQNAFRAAGYSRTTVLPLLASEFGVPQHRRRIFWFGLRDGLPLKGDLADVVRELMGPQKTPRPVTVRQAISDLPEEVSEDDGPIPYAKKRAGRYSEYQKLMRLDYDSPLLPSGRKKTDGDDALYNHHTKGVEARRKKIIKAIKPGATGNSLPAELWNGTRDHKWRRWT
jgi:DNA (cytosine-5)-methyltransferase 1